MFRPGEAAQDKRAKRKDKRPHPQHHQRLLVAQMLSDSLILSHKNTIVKSRSVVQEICKLVVHFDHGVLS